MQRLAQTSTGSNVALSTLTALSLSLNGCAVIGGIFKAGMWVGVIAVFVVVALIVWGIRAATR